MCWQIVFLSYAFFTSLACSKYSGFIEENIVGLNLEDSTFLDFPSFRYYQSMVFFDNNVILLTNREKDLICDVYGIETRERVHSFLLPHDGYATPHANVTCLGLNRAFSNSLFPSLYVSAWNAGRQVFVYDISQVGNNQVATLIQVIDPKHVSKEILGSGFLDWVVDGENGMLYALSYHLEDTSRISDGNYIHVTSFYLPDIHCGGIVYLRDYDVIDFFTLPVMTVFQDKCFWDGHILVLAGDGDSGGQHPSRLFDIDLEQRRFIENRIPLSGEPEGLSIYKGIKWINMFGSTQIYNLDKLLKE